MGTLKVLLWTFPNQTEIFICLIYGLLDKLFSADGKVSLLQYSCFSLGDKGKWGRTGFNADHFKACLQ